ncbi:MAG: hypothetical protein U0941_21885 [Planctomycetaceae bacterium]
MTSVYMLKPVFDDPRFNRLDFDLEPSFIGNKYLHEDLDGKNPGKLYWEPVSLVSMWKPCRLLGKAEPYQDFPAASSQIPIFSRRAVEALKDLLQPSGELLPAVASCGEYFVYNILCKSDAFDTARSKATFMPSSGKETALSIERYELDPAKFAGHAIFRLREDPWSVMVTDRFKERVEKTCLNGFFFARIWPLAADENWDDLETRQRKADRKAAQALKGQCVTILLTIAGREATDDEEKAGLELVATLSDFLVSQSKSLDDECLGAIDYLEPFRGKLGIHVACPDVDKVMPIIQPWLDSLVWPNAVVLDKYYGNRFEKQTRKVRVKIKS